MWRGQIRVEFRNRVVELAPGDILIVPCGVEHRTVAEHEAEVVVFEPGATRNTGDVVNQQFTAPNGVKI